jgi:drug/metabolite transporter (DMT)-like permease
MPRLNARAGVKTWLLTGVVILANVLGNFSLSWGMKHSPEDLSLAGLARTIFTPFVLLGIGLLVLWLLTRLTLLSWADLTFVLPVTAVGYVLTALIGKVFLHEDVSWQRWAGTLLIVAGTALVGSTQPRTTTGEAEAER